MLCIHMTKKLLRWSVGDFSASRSQAHQKGCSFNTRQSGDLCVVSSFALCAVLLRLREFPANGFGRSKNIIPVVYAVNKDALDCEIPHSLGRKCPLEETSKCQCRIAVLH